MGLFENSKELQLGRNKLWQIIGKSSKEEKIILWRKRRKLAGVVLNETPLELGEFREMMVSRWLSCWGS